MRKSKADLAGQVPIYLRITLNGERVEISVNRRIDLTKWDSKTQRAKGRSEAARTLNDYLDSLEVKVKKDYNTLLGKDEEISAAILRDMFSGTYRKEYYLMKSGIRFYGRRNSRIF